MPVQLETHNSTHLMTEVCVLIPKFILVKKDKTSQNSTILSLLSAEYLFV